jgi:hypothetical protein
MMKNLFLVVAFSLMLFVVACDDYPFPIDPGKDFARVMITHASPDAPNVDVYLDEKLFAEDFAYPNSTRYTSLREGTYDLALKPTGSDDSALEAELDVVAKEYYSVFACDEVANLSALVLNDDFGEPALEEAMVRFVHLSPDAPAVDITLTDGTVVFPNIEFKGATGFEPLEFGEYDLQVRLAGTEDVVLEVNDVKLLPHAAYTIWAKGFVDGDEGQELGAEIIFHKFLR